MWRAPKVLTQLFRGNARTIRSRRPAPATPRARLAVEILESRTLLSGLQVSIAPHTIYESGPPTTAVATVTRTNVTSQPLTVYLKSSDTTEATVPGSVIIPANQASATATVSAVADNQPDGAQTATISAMAQSAATASPDTSFGGTGGTTQSTITEAVAIQSDGKIVAAGLRYNGGNSNFYDFAVTRYTATGSLDTTFGGTGTVYTDVSGQSDKPHSVVIQSDGKIVVAGSGGDGPRFFYVLARYNTDGSLDTTFGSGGKVVYNPNTSGNSSEVWQLALQSDGKVLAAGYENVGNFVDFAVTRFNTNGTLDTSFGSGGTALSTPLANWGGIAYGIALQSDGRIIVAGTSKQGNFDSLFALSRFTATGALDTTFGGTGNVLTNLTGGDYDQCHGVVIQPDGKIIAVGYTSQIGTSPPVFNYALVRYNPNGSLDTSFGSSGVAINDFGGNDQAQRAALQPDGRIIVVGGGVGSSNSTERTLIASYNPDGTLGGSVAGSHTGVQGQDILIQADGRIVAASMQLATFGGYVERYNDFTVLSGSDTVSVLDAAGPTAVNDYFTAFQNATVIVPANLGVLANDTDSGGLTLTAILVTGPTHGNLALSSDGSFTYTPTTGYMGSDSFTYKANDGAADSNVATVSLNVIAPSPTANNDAYSTNENQYFSVAAPGVLANDTDPNGNPLTAFLYTQPAHGSLQLSSNGAFFYQPNLYFYGTDSFTYIANNGSSNSAQPGTVTITIAHVNQPPTAVSHSYSLNENAALSVQAPGVLANNSDPDGDPLTALLASGPAHGSLTFNSDGSFTYTPTANYFGTDSFRYQSSDGSLTSNTATVTLTINTTDHAPVANNDAYNVSQGTSLSIQVPGVLANDTDADGDPLTVVLANSPASPGPAHGTLTLNANGSFVYTPDPSYTGTDSFRYQAYDGILYSSVATVTLTVAAVPPTAANDAYSVNEDTMLTVAAPGVLANDTQGSTGTMSALIVSTVSHGTLSFNSNGAFTYTPATHYYGTDSFTYHDAAGSLMSNTATVTLTVNFVNHAPLATGDTYSVNEDSALTVTVPTGTTSLVMSSQPGDYIGQGRNYSFSTATGSFGVYRNYDNGVSFSYQDLNPNIWWYVDFAGPNQTTLVPGVYNGAVRFPFQGPNQPGLDIAGEGRGSNTLTGAFTVIQANYLPSGQVVGYDATFIQHSEGATPALTGEIKYNYAPTAPGVLSNDSDVDGQALSAVLVAGPSHGTLTLNADGTFNYTPTADYFGTDSFTYMANDGALNSNVATVTLTVNPVNDVPTFVKGADQTLVEGASAQTIPGWATAIAAGPANEASQALNFVVTTNNSALFAAPPAIDPATGTLTYTPAPGALGTAQVTVQLHDNGGTANGGVDTSAAQTFNITVNDAVPVLSLSGAASVNEKSTYTLGLSATDPDPIFNWTITWGDGNVQTVAGNPSSVTHVYAQGPNSYTISATATDEDGTFAAGNSVAVTVNHVHLSVSGPASATAGVSQDITVSVLDPLGNPDTDYAGTIHFATTDVSGSVPADYTFVPGDAGSHVFASGATLATAGTQTISAVDTTAPAINGSLSVVVSPAAAATLVVTGFPATTAGAAQTFTVTAFDAFGNVATGYAGTVHFTSSDSQAMLPGDYTFVGSDAGAHSFGASLATAGTQSIGGSDGSLSGTQGNIVVNPASAATLIVAGFSATTAGVAQTFAVTARDAFGNVATGYAGTVHFTSSDRQATVPGDYTFGGADAGTHTFSATLKTAGTQSLSASDGSLSGTEGGIVISPASAAMLSTAGFPATTAGVAQPFTVTARDAFGNLATGYVGTVHFTSSDSQAALPGDYTFAGGDAGTHAFSATLKTAGTQAISAGDGALSGTQGGIVVSPATAATLSVAGFPATTAGVAQTFTVTARDAFGNLATGYAGTVHFTSSDSQAALPGDFTFGAGDGGAHTFSATLKTTGTQSITGNDGSLSGTQTNISVSAAAAATLTLAGYPATTAGLAQSFTVTARDAFGNLATGYAGTVHFSSSDGQAALPVDYPFGGADAGTHTFSATLKTAGTQSISAGDGTLGSTQGNIAVSPASAATLSVAGFPATTAGAAQSYTVTARDAFGNTATGYTGTVHFTSSDSQAVLPGDYPFGGGDAGTHSFSATLKTAGNQSITASAGALSGTQANIAVSPAAAATLVVAGFPTTTAGVAHAFTVTARDAYGNLATSYTGTVHFMSTDGQASLPANYTFVSGDGGTHTFSATLKTAGTQSISAADTATAAVAGTQANISVSAAAAVSVVLSGFPASTVAGVAHAVTVTVRDAYGNLATGYTGTVHFTSSDGKATLPVDYTFTAADAGSHTFSVVLATAGTQSVTVTDQANASLTSTQGSISVGAAAAATVTVAGYPSSTTAGSANTFTVTLRDAYGNIATGYTGTLHFTSSDLQAGLPADYTFTTGDAGAHTFSATLKTAGTQSLTATDKAVAALSGSQGNIAVMADAATHFSISAPASATTNSAFTIVVTALDAYGNVATGYRGHVHFSSSDRRANLPGDYTFKTSDNGVHTFTVTLKSVGTDTITVTDTTTGSITGSASVNVLK